MKVNKSVNVQLSAGDLEALRHGETLTVPVDKKQSIHIYPPKQVQDND